jgi:carbon storage regulator CsrA
MIGDDIEIRVIDIRGEKVRLGISAPPHIPVHRKEVYLAIQKEKRAAALVAGGNPDAVTGVESLAMRKKEVKAEDPQPSPPETAQSKG